MGKLVTVEDYCMMAYGNRNYTSLSAFGVHYASNGGNDARLVRAGDLKNNVGYYNGTIPCPGGWPTGVYSMDDNTLLKVEDLERNINISNSGVYDPYGYCHGYAPGYADVNYDIAIINASNTLVSTIYSGRTSLGNITYKPPSENNSVGVAIPRWLGNSYGPYSVAIKINSFHAISNNNQPATFTFEYCGDGYHLNANQQKTFYCNTDWIRLLTWQTWNTTIRWKLTVTGT